MREITIIHNKRDRLSKKDYDRYYYHHIYKYRDKSKIKVKFNIKHKKYLIKFD
jgi:hypothetical protein